MLEPSNAINEMKHFWHTLGPLVTIGHLMATLMASSSRIMHHITKLELFQIGFLNMAMSSLY